MGLLGDLPVVGGLFGGKKGGGMGVPSYSGPKFKMKKTEDFLKPPEKIEVGGAGARDAMQRRFQQQREQAIGAVNAGHSQNMNAIQRRFASMGAQGSGAQLEIEQQAAQKANDQKLAATAALDAAQEDATFQRDSAQSDMDFRQQVFAFEKGSKMHELDLAERQQQISQSQDKYSAEMNAFINQPKKQGLIGGILDDIF